MSLPVPISERKSRLPVAGRIRLGVKGKTSTGKVKPQSIDTFRFTSRSGADITAIAELYGGDPRPWSDPKSEDRFEVITTSNEIKVALPPDPLGDSYYELWGGRGLLRQCDGIVCSSPVQGPQGTEFAEGPCLCRDRGIKECKPKLRLSVILPELPLRGVWRLETGSEAALDEMPGMVRTLEGLQGEGLTVGLLRLERRQSSGGSKRYVVPVLGLAESLEGLIAGRARLAALPAAPTEAGGERVSVRLSIPPGSEPIAGNCGLDQDKGGWEEDEVVEAELVDEPSAAEKARQLRTARHQAVLEGREPPNAWDEIDAADLP